MGCICTSPIYSGSHYFDINSNQDACLCSRDVPIVNNVKAPIIYEGSNREFAGTVEKIMNIRKFIIWFSIAGASFFALAFTLSFTSPALLESVAKTIIRLELESRVAAKLEAIGDGKVGKSLGRMLPNQADEI